MSNAKVALYNARSAAFNQPRLKTLAPGFHENLIARARFIDDLIEKSAAEGVEQYVIGSRV